MNTTNRYLKGQVVELHFLRMEDSTTWILLQKDGRSSGRSYHVTPAQAELLPRRLTLRQEVFSVHPAVCYVRLPEGAIHHRHLAFTHQELAACDFAAAAPAAATPAARGVKPVQLIFNF